MNRRAGRPRLTAQQQIVLAAIVNAANGGRVCPTNQALSDMLGSDGAASALRVVKSLEAKGLIRIRRFSTARQVTVCVTGKRTALPDDTRPHWRDADAARPPAPVKAARPRPKLGPRRRNAPFSQDGDPALPDDEIEARCGLRAAERREHEEYWLREEQRKYGLPRKGRPLSEMIA